MTVRELAATIDKARRRTTRSVSRIRLTLTVPPGRPEVVEDLWRVTIDRRDTFHDRFVPSMGAVSLLLHPCDWFDVLRELPRRETAGYVEISGRIMDRPPGLPRFLGIDVEPLGEYRRLRGLEVTGDTLRDDWPYRWFWRAKLGDRRGDRCRVWARGKMNSIGVEFLDGHRTVTARHAVRRAR